MQHLNFRQCMLETAHGDIVKAAKVHAEAGDETKALSLFQLALAVKAQRDPEVVEFLERRALKRARQAGASA